MSDLYFDKAGDPVDVNVWAYLFSRDEYKRVAKDVLSDGKVVSTVWLGLDHSYGESDAPLIFETMIFPNEEDYSDLFMERYSTEEEAIEGHARAIEMAGTLEH